jgi:UTP--glucose-1-phosphate uridylyltransferase
MFDERFPQGTPSLVQCTRLRLEGDIRFEGGVTIIGDVRLTNTRAEQAVIKANTVVAQDLRL